MIKRIELINFMSHEHTVIEPAAGLTVLAGPNNCGKSAVVTALQVLCHNDNSTYVLRHEQKNCQIIVETDDGHVVEWSRKKNGSPKYLINDKPFDRLKQGVPPELHAALRLPRVSSDKVDFDIHFGEQKRPIFLLNDPPKAAAEFFASSSDAIRLVEMQALHKQRVRDAKREQNRLELERDEIARSLEKLLPVQELQKRVEDCEKQFFQINVDCDRIETKENVVAKIKRVKGELARHEMLSQGYAALDAPPDFADTESLQRLVTQFEKTNFLGNKNAALEQAFEPLAAPPTLEDEDWLESLISNLALSEQTIKQLGLNLVELNRVQDPPQLCDERPLSAIIEKIEKQNALGKRLDTKLAKANKKLANAISEIESWAAANPVCPTCRGPVEVANLVSAGATHSCLGGRNE